MKQKYIQECTNCGNVVVGREKRGFIRDALHGGPGTAVEFIPVGGKLIWKASKLSVPIRVLLLCTLYVVKGWFMVINKRPRRGFSPRSLV